MRFGPFAIGTCVTLLVGASAAEAQVTADQMTRGRPARLMTLRSTASVLYDSNVTQTSSGALPRGGLSKDDVIFTPGLSVNLVQPLASSRCFSAVTPDISFTTRTRPRTPARSMSAAERAVASGPAAPSSPATILAVAANWKTSRLPIRSTISLNVNAWGLPRPAFRAPGLGIQLNVGQEWAQNSLPTTRLADYETISAGGGAHPRKTVLCRRYPFRQLSRARSIRTDPS